MTSEPTVSVSQMAQALAPMAAPEIKKIIVAIHGIGDQYRNATVQSVVNIFSRCFDQTAAVPLGAFYSADGQIRTFQLTAPPDVAPDLIQLGFVEAYWADIPRRAQRRGYTIEETKAWARTVVARVQSRYEQDLASRLKLTREDYASAAAVLDEMIDAIGVLGNLTFLAEKAGLFKFDLDDLLTSFVGDVQIVADFANYRERVARHVWNILEAVHANNEEAEIYLVAHSEGTVVTLFTLLKALCVGTQNPPPPPRPGWIEQVRGLMTIGSPIDKHIVLWMRMWDDVERPDLSQPLNHRIAWRNYYDYADPVGFKLDTAREWLRDHQWTEFFEFEPTHDFGFARYFLPGKAHVDYWNDPLVFGHFIYDVLGLKPVVDGEKIEAPPPSRNWARFSSYITPYFLILLTLAAAVYLMHSALNGLIKQNEGWIVTIRHVLGLTCLLAGTTVASRIPCLTRKVTFKLWSAGLFALFAIGYLTLYSGWSWSEPLFIRKRDLLAIILAVVAVCFSIWSDRHKTLLQRWPPVRVFARGMRPLLIAGGLAAAILVVQEIKGSGHGGDNLWPLILSSAAFIYLWWLSAILFDLFFTWQRYIRLAVWQEYLKQARKDRIVRERPFWRRWKSEAT
jgi:hypothetical protein